MAVNTERMRHQPTGPAASPNWKGSILLVDDDESVLAVTRKILCSLGYRVRATGAPSEALELARAQPEGFDLLLTDFHMPGMDGCALAKRISDFAPACAVLFMSGCPPSALGGQSDLDPGRNFLQKPFSIDVLAQKVRATLERAGSGEPDPLREV